MQTFKDILHLKISYFASDFPLKHTFDIRIRVLRTMRYIQPDISTFENLYVPECYAKAVNQGCSVQKVSLKI